MAKLGNKIAVWIYRWGQAHSSLFSSPRVAQELERLYPGVLPSRLLERYYVKKITLSLAVFLIGILLGGVISFRAAITDIDASGGIVRGSYKEGEKEVDLVGTFQEGAQQFHVQIAPRRLSAEELEQLYHMFCENLPAMVMGDNLSLERIEKNLRLEESYSDYPFTVTWESSDPELITSEGVVSMGENIGEVILKANICYEDFEWVHEIAVTVSPMPEEEALRIAREQMLTDSEQNSRDEEQWMLPEEWQGEKIKWKQVKEDKGILFAGAGLGIAVLLFFMADKDLYDNVEKRRQCMREKYPEIVHKLILYMGAGLTIRGSFQKITENFITTKREKEEQKDYKKQKHYKEEQAVYEEILYLCRELQTGVSESAAYEHLGKRTGVQEYIRLGTLLTQNLKKGSNTLLVRLQEEAEKANEGHMHYVRKRGEEAETKLLLPMVMMLLVVMLLIMLPAFWTVGMG